MCKDKSVSHLNGLGFNVIRLPRENIDPLLILCKSNGSLETLGEISDFVIEDQPKPPEIASNKAVSEIAGIRTDKFELGVGLKFLEKFLSLIGAAGIGLEARFENADSIQFVYQDVLTDYILPTKIGKYLSSVSPNVNSSFMDSIDEEGEAYVITDTLKSNAFGVVAYDKNDIELALDISALQQLLNVAPKVKLSKEENNVLTFKGDKFLSFAFKAIVVWVEVGQGKAIFRLNKPAGAIAPLKAVPATFIDPNEPSYIVFGENTLIKLK